MKIAQRTIRPDGLEPSGVVRLVSAVPTATLQVHHGPMFGVDRARWSPPPPSSDPRNVDRVVGHGKWVIGVPDFASVVSLLDTHAGRVYGR